MSFIPVLKLRRNMKHLVHLYDGNESKLNDGKEVLNKLRGFMTMSRTPLSFGYFDQNRSGWNALNFVGLMDDFRVYDIARRNRRLINYMETARVMYPLFLP